MSKGKKDLNGIEPWEFKGLPSPPPDAAASAFNPKNIVRKSFRQPILEEESVHVEIDGQTYRVIDIGSHGLGIAVPHPATLNQGLRCALRLYLADKRLELQGEVSHTSPGNESGEYRCGIKLMEMSPPNEEKLQQFLSAHHATLFKKE